MDVHVNSSNSSSAMLQGQIEVHEIRKIMDKKNPHYSSRKIRNQKFVFPIVNTWITVTVPHVKVKVEINLRHRGRKANIFTCFFEPYGFLP